MSFLSNEQQHRLKEMGKQELADDPRVVAVFNFPLADITFYITGYDVPGDHYTGYIRGEGLNNNQASFPRQGIDDLHELRQTLPFTEKGLLTLNGEQEPRISELLPEMKQRIATARLERLTEDREKKKGKDKGQEQEL